jgi:hypothetical protein
MNSDAALQRYAPLICWMAALLTVLFICLKILASGFLPSGDARRHVAKPFADKPYSEIVVMRPEYVVDHSPGWEWLLGVLHRTTQCNEDALMSFSVASLLLCVLCFPLIWMRHPEAWLAAVLAQMVAIPEVMTRWTQGRPFLLTEGILMGLLFSWSKEDGRRPPWWKVAATCLGFCLSVWMHGAWYLWVLLLAAFFLAQRWRAGLWLSGCWVAGTIAGALLTGKPLAFLNGALFMARSIYQEHLPKWMLVGEFQPSTGEFATVILLAVVYLWRRRGNNVGPPLAKEPVVWMIAINWVLGLSADRFWADWGLAAGVVWMAMQFDEEMTLLWNGAPIKRLVLCGMIALPLFLDSTNDLGRRYTFFLNEVFVDAGDPQLNGWMPGHGGIVYAGNMRFFYNTFYKNPQGDWRYIAGFEPALMPPDDLKIYRNIQRTGGAIEAYEPWVKKMRPQDRLEMDSQSEPNLPALEWKRAGGDVWIGRLLPVRTSPRTEK